ncbi:GNAT family N-acetyltransferase [Paenibacillus spongiae]|uniref:GNAT family N-acetyltransferase n=1 Tax=Paenibacillus spongiae TaxID=2909671 RepID=A0ABY5SKS4_9BACL|nr:GNAT family N-acetyltransferase [Paenibacillus spongiae]UVI33120.1 GNAT family N-acetyltransferase [Paenibacillus spongiae]
MIRQADLSDLNLLIQVDLKDEGITSTTAAELSEEDLFDHRTKIMKFITDKDRGVFIYEDKNSKKRLGLLMYSIVNRDAVYPWKTIFHELDRRLFQVDGRFIEIFQLWVDPNHRRLGIATELKQTLEDIASSHDIHLIYTHTEEQNLHVIELNSKLGYKEVRRGPIWDEVIRVSLIKQL